MSASTQSSRPDGDRPVAESDLERCWYVPIESGLGDDQVMDVAACCHGIRRRDGSSSSATSLGAMRNCRQCGFIL